MSTIKLGLFLEPSFMVSQISAAAAAKSLQSGPTLSDPMDCSLPGSSIHVIFQARVLEWVAISFPRRSSQPREFIFNHHDYINAYNDP